MEKFWAVLNLDAIIEFDSYPENCDWFLEASLKLKTLKCNIFQNKVFSHKCTCGISRNTNRFIQEYVISIWVESTHCQEFLYKLRFFYRLAAYYCRFLRFIRYKLEHSRTLNSKLPPLHWHDLGCSLSKLFTNRPLCHF